MKLYSNNDTNVNFIAYNDAEKSIQYRKTNASTRFNYYDLAHNNSHKQKQMITFTYNDDNALFKMQVINDIRNYFNKLVRNLNTTSTRFFSNIELGDSFDNPHVHIQVWHEEADAYDLKRVYDKVVQRYGLCVDRCVVSLEEAKTDVFHYVVKDYSKKMSDEQTLELNMWRAWYRKELGKNLRFTSHSKSLHTKALYKKAYSLGIKKNDLDWLIENDVITSGLVFCDDEVALRMVFFGFLSVLVQVYNKWIECSAVALYQGVFISFYFEYWVFGFL